MGEINKIITNWSSFITDPVFYLPVLGPVFMPEGKEVVLHDLIVNYKFDVFLSYDKNKRWYSSPQEKILVDKIYFADDFILVPVMNKNKLKIFYYSNKPLNQLIYKKIIELSEQLNQGGNYKKFQLFVFNKPEVDKSWVCHNIYIQKLDNGFVGEHQFDLIHPYIELPLAVQNTFELMGQDVDLDGFGFLWHEYLKKKKHLSKILCIISDGAVIGAIGPLDILSDSNDRKFLLPPYFGLRAPWRGKGMGAKLWQAAMKCAFDDGAEYTLVQNQPGTRAAEFYEEQGLENAEQVYSLEIY
ncbi:hypothetical protein COT97_04025 [Candidatus Falkowbacteria bacterium CG10_big_fil_rev_8_21_14_0_10_39_11]|uniref:N-acetyltransferase domain-containing protein n=1 Tax=Candidatus Falkowbacteria bacterium CG10_big_fil_rev_8_21_14_0_10_39_11 TaxID=1974565 RepID=A0A2H0V4E8_9BACT|nr:MAG: hypothetical protein COT97_04025 [Candidatus Falkowbacteria bacterium CG10_big_fil_rev_8_21_14_0_10_39_11]